MRCPLTEDGDGGQQCEMEPPPRLGPRLQRVALLAPPHEEDRLQARRREICADAGVCEMREV